MFIENFCNTAIGFKAMSGAKDERLTTRHLAGSGDVHTNSSVRRHVII